MWNLHATLLTREYKKEALREQSVNQVPLSTRNSANSQLYKLTHCRSATISFHRFSGESRSVRSNDLNNSSNYSLLLSSNSTKTSKLVDQTASWKPWIIIEIRLLTVILKSLILIRVAVSPILTHIYIYMYIYRMSWIYGPTRLKQIERTKLNKKVLCHFAMLTIINV